MSSLPALVVTGDERHGVTIAARNLTAAVETVTGLRLHLDAEALLSAHPPTRAHLHFTDRLWARSSADAASVIEHIAARTALTITLHDVPQTSDGPHNLPRRIDCYTRIVQAARGIVVNSGHEAAHLAQAGIPSGTFTVVPLPVTPVPPVPSAVTSPPDVVVLGFFYPGKGHTDVIDAVANLPVKAASRPRVTVLGSASRGHEADLRALVERAAQLGVTVEVTGFLSEQDLIARCRTATVPVVAHRHFSASGSLNTWIATGRRPLVIDGRYAREMAALRPGTAHLVPPGTLTEAITGALADPASSWLAADTVTRPHLPDTATAYLRWWTEDVRW